MNFFLVFFLLFFLQFVYFPIGVTFFEVPKVIVTEGVIGLLIAKVLVEGKFPLSNYHRLALWVLGGIGILGLFDVLFLRTQTTFLGNAYRMQGVFLLWLLLAFAVLSSKVQGINKYLILGIILLQFLLALVISGNGVERAIGLLGEPNALAATMVFLWPFLIFQRKGKNRKGEERKLKNNVIASSQKATRQSKFYDALYKNNGILSWSMPLQNDMLMVVGSLLVLFTILLSGSRSGMVAFGIEVIFLLLVRFTQLSLKFITVICLVLMFCSYSLVFFEPHQGVYEHRLEVWKAAGYAGITYPILGSGFGNQAKPINAADWRLSDNLRWSYVDSAHNIFLDWFVQGGVVGVALFIALLLIVFRSFIVAKRVRELVLLIGLLTALSFNPASVVGLVQLWWIIGQGIRAE